MHLIFVLFNYFPGKFPQRIFVPFLSRPSSVEHVRSARDELFLVDSFDEFRG